MGWGILLCLAASLQVEAAGLTSTGLTAQQVLEQSDRVRNGDVSALVKVKVTYYKKDEIEQQDTFEVYATGADRALVKSLDARSRGLRVLLLGDDMWISLPDVSRPVRITPMQRLVGQASSGDVAKTHYALDYEPTLVREEVVGKRRCALLDLKARRRGATYQRIEYWVDLATLEPVKAAFYLTSGKKSKTATFDEFTTFFGQRMVSRITIRDLILPEEHTTIEYLSAVPKDFPESYFNKNRMSQF